MELIKKGLLSSMEYKTTTIVASKHHGRKVVLNHYIQSPRAKLKEQVENSGYGYPGQGCHFEDKNSRTKSLRTSRTLIFYIYILVFVLQIIYIYCSMADQINSPPPKKKKKKKKKKK